MCIGSPCAGNAGGQYVYDARILWLEITDERAIAEHIKAVEVRQGFALNAEQKAAVQMVLSNRFSLLTGSAGVGRSTVLNVVLAVAKASNLPIYKWR